MLVKFGNFKEGSYKGIAQKAVYGLHDDMYEMLKPFLHKDLSILDFGCGEGAFSQRLVDLGFNVDACDIDTTQVKAKVNNLITLDLNKPNISDSFNKKYDCIIAMEVIEHVESPWKFIRDMMSILNNSGIILLSTPNISNFASRLRFFMRGTFLGFEKNDLSYGHISPMNFFYLENMFKSLELKILDKKCVGKFPLIHFVNPSIFMMFRNFIIPFFYPFMSGDKNGRSLSYIIKKQ
jgi:2-polyprenyl-3-methyl-5-hydroxy-6-metoxy-1,4-benzoquinol methylase